MTKAAALSRILLVVWIGPSSACAEAAPSDDPPLTEPERSAVIQAIDSAVWSFHAADGAMDAEAVLSHLWPEFTMQADGAWTSYDDVAAGTRQFMAGLQLFHTDWTELRIIPLGRSSAVSSFQFRDSIVTTSGDLIQSRGPTTLIWERRDGEWRIVFGDADHYPLEGSSAQSAEAGPP